LNSDSPALTEYLEEVAVHLPGSERADVLMELESHVLDRAEEEAGPEPDEAAIRAVIKRLGDPMRVASAYSGSKYIVGPGVYRAFVAYTAILFAAHILMILIGVATGAQIHLFPARIASDSPSPRWFELFGIAVHALLFDIGLMVVIFGLAAHTGSALRTPKLVFRVRRSPRAAIARILLGLIVIACLTVGRDRIFIVVEEGHPYSVLTHGFSDSIVLIAGFLLLGIGKEVAYAFRGEGRLTLSFDAIVGLVGAGLMVALVAGSPLIAFPDGLKSVAPLQPGLNELMHRVLQIMLAVMGVAIAAASVKRLVRLRQIWE
jgi:HAAS